MSDRGHQHRRMRVLALLVVLSAVGGGWRDAAGGLRGAGATPRPGPPNAIWVDGASGDDLAPGSSTAPLATVQEALHRVVPGDTICLCGGDYRSQGPVTIALRGSAASPVRLVRCSDAAVVVSEVRLVHAEWVTVAGLTVVGPHTLPAGWRDMPAVVVDDPTVVIDPSQPWPLRRSRVAAKYASYSTIVSPTGAPSWERDHTAGIDVVASRHITLLANDVSFHTVGIDLREDSRDLVVRGNSLHHLVDGLRGDRDDPALASFSDTVIEGNRLRQIYREGIRLTAGARRVVVRDNLVEYTAHSHIATYAAGGDILIRHNLVRFGGYYAETMRFPGPSGISLHSAGPAAVADGNTVVLQLDATLRDGNGIIVDYSPERTSVINNVILRTQGSGVASVSSGDATIVHNTIVDAGFMATAPANGVGIRMVTADDIGNVIANNLVFRPRHGGLSFEAGTLAEQDVVDFNLLFTPGAPLVGDGLAPGNLFWTLSALQAAGWCNHTTAADPLLDDGGHAAGQLRAGSPAIGAGTPAHSVAEDRVGTRRDPQQPTIGAFEPGVRGPRGPDGRVGAAGANGG